MYKHIYVQSSVRIYIYRYILTVLTWSSFLVWVSGLQLKIMIRSQFPWYDFVTLWHHDLSISLFVLWYPFLFRWHYPHTVFLCHRFIFSSYRFLLWSTRYFVHFIHFIITQCMVSYFIYKFISIVMFIYWLFYYSLLLFLVNTFS